MHIIPFYYYYEYEYLTENTKSAESFLVFFFLFSLEKKNDVLEFTKLTVSLQSADKIVEPKLSSYGETSGNKTIHTPPPSLHLKLRCLLFLRRVLEQWHNIFTTLHRSNGEGKLYLLH